MLLHFLCEIVRSNANLDNFFILNLIEVEWVRIWNPILNKIRLLREIDQGKRNTPVYDRKIVVVNDINFFVDLLEYFVPFWLNLNRFSGNFFDNIEHLNARRSPNVNVLLLFRVNLYYWRLKREASLFKLQFTIISTWIQLVVNHSHNIYPALMLS